MKKIHTGWFKDVWWKYYTADGIVRDERGMYLICDNGYLHWPQSIFSFLGQPSHTLEGYFSSNLESVRKDVECTFGILKKRWKILNNGLMFCDIKFARKYLLCAVASTTSSSMPWCITKFGLVGGGYPIDDDGLWLSGNININKIETERVLATRFGLRRSLLAKHLHAFWRLGPIPD